MKEKTATTELRDHTRYTRYKPPEGWEEMTLQQLIDHDTANLKRRPILPEYAALPDIIARQSHALELAGYWKDEDGEWHEPHEGVGNDGANSMPPRTEGQSGSTINRARNYVSKMNPSIAGSGGHDSAYLAAQAIVRGFCLSAEEGLPILQEFNQRCTPPWSENELQHKLESAQKDSRRDWGYIINKPKPSGFTTWQSRYEKPREDVALEPSQVDEGSPKTETFPLHFYPEQLRRLIYEISNSMSAPPDFPATAILALVGAAIGCSRAIEIKRGWLECPRFYMAHVCSPGSTKSPSVEALCKPFYDKQNEENKKWQERNTKYKADVAHFEKAKKQTWKNNGGNTAIPDEPVRPVYPHIYTTDATTEGLAPILSSNPRGVILIKDEISGWALSMNQYKGGKGSDRQFWLSSWSGAPAKIDRKGQDGPIIIPHPFINVMGGIQPDMLQELCDDKNREDGFIHRILFCYPDPEFGGYWTETQIDRDTEFTWRDFISWLWSLEAVEEEGATRPKVVRFTDDAKRVFVAWHNDHADEIRKPGFPYKLTGPWAKLKSYCARIAVVMQMIRNYFTKAEEAPIDGYVDAESMLAACGITTYFKNHLRKVYQHLTFDDRDKLIGEVVAWLKETGGQTTGRELLRKRYSKSGTEAVELIAEMVDRGLGESWQTENTNKTQTTHFKLTGYFGVVR